MTNVRDAIEVRILQKQENLLEHQVEQERLRVELLKNDLLRMQDQRREKNVKTSVLVDARNWKDTSHRWMDVSEDERPDPGRGVVVSVDGYYYVAYWYVEESGAAYWVDPHDQEIIEGIEKWFAFPVLEGKRKR